MNVLHTLLGIVIVINLVIGFILGRIIRIFIGIFFRFKYGEPIDFVDTNDAGFATDWEKNRHFPSGYLMIDGKVTIEDMRQRIRDAFLDVLNPNGTLKFPKLRKLLKLELSYYFWQRDPNFKIENHVQELNCELPKTMDDLYKIMGEVVSNLSMDVLPPWRIYIINLPKGLPGYPQRPICFFWFIYHHAVTDAVNVLRIIQTKLYDIPVDFPDYVKNSRPKLSLMQKITIAVGTILYAPGVLAKDFLQKDDSVLRMKPVTGKKLISFSKTIDLNRVKRVKNMTKTTVNDVATSVFAGAVLKHLVAEKLPVPKHCYLGIPFALHDFSKNEFAFSNNTSFITIDLPVQEADALARLRKTKKEFNKLKSSPEAYVHDVVMRFVVNALPRFIMYNSLASNSMNGIFTNVCSSQDRLVMFGKDVLHNGGLAAAGWNIGLAISAITGKGTLEYGIAADTAVMKNQEMLNRFVGFINKEFDELEKEAEKEAGMNGAK